MSDGKTHIAVGIESNRDVSRIVYDIDLMVGILCEREGLNEDEAIEYISFNVIGAYIGEGSPIYIHRMNAEEIANYKFD
jgi:hypothetical protein